MNKRKPGNKKTIRKYEYKGKTTYATNKEQANRKLGYPLTMADLRTIKEIK